jgi:hypothetical protein
MPRPLVACRAVFVEARQHGRRPAPPSAIQQRLGLHDVLLCTTIDNRNRPAPSQPAAQPMLSRRAFKHSPRRAAEPSVVGSSPMRSQAVRRAGDECNRPQRSAFLRVPAVVGTIDVAAPRLIWRAVCQGLRHEFPAFAGRGSGVLGWVGGGPACCGRRRRNSPSVTTPPGSGQLDSAPTRRYRCGCS